MMAEDTASLEDESSRPEPSRPIRQAMSQRIASKRTERGLTVKQVADHIGISVQSIYFYEKGEREPTGENLFALADVLGVSARWIVTGSDDGTARPVPISIGVHSVIEESLACLNAYVASGCTSISLVHAAIRILESGKEM